MVFEENYYEGQCLDKKPKKLIVIYMLFPQNGCQIWDAWPDAEQKPWTTHMSKARFL
jgi:hypothetical protein